jgi:TolB-like protein/Tfp pilus assembly protein PilF
MSEPNNAVFLSYSSQDAAAAQRICEALRAGGIEVWFDQSELRGGDAWDQKIRRQIRECALFVPIISANTAARHEGYFRLEWNLADERTQKIARNKAFIVPVCLDATSDSDSDVPDSFSRVQWTRLPAGDTPATFVRRVAELLSTSPAALPAQSFVPAESRADTKSVARRLPRWLPTVVLVAIAVAALGYLTLDKLILPKRALDHDSASIATSPRETGSNSVDDKSIAVLPFVDLSEKKDQEYFSDGLAEELLDLLAKTPGLHVIARTSSFSFKGKSDDIPTIARKLNVANILEGSVRKSGNRLRVTTQLIRARSGEDFWSETYDRELKDVFQVQDEIAGAVVAALKVSLLSAAPSVSAPTTNTESYTSFLKCTQSARLESREATEAAIAYCRRAVDLDPNFAPAWATLGDLIRQRFVAFGGNEPYEQARAESYAAFQHALALDPKRAVIYVGLASLYEQMDFDPVAAAKELQRASELEPASAGLLWMRGYEDSVQGRFDEALSNLQRALVLDPVNAGIELQIGNTNYRAGKFPEAAAAYRDALASQPSMGSVHYRLGLVNLALKDPSAALAEMEQEPDRDFHACGLPLALDALGRKHDADVALAQAEKISSVGAAYQIALIYAARHDVGGAVGWLNAAYRQRDAGMLWIKADPLLQGLRSDERFQALLVKMHLN